MEVIIRMLLYILELLPDINWAEWTKGICHVWSRGRHFPPSLPGHRYLKLGSGPKSRGASFGKTLWHHVQRYCCLGILFGHAQFPRTEVPTIFMGRNICVRSTKNLTPRTRFTRATWLQNVSSLKLGIENNTVHCSSKSCLVQSSSIVTFTTSNLSFLWKGEPSCYI